MASNKNKKYSRRAWLAAAFLPLFLLGKPVFAQEAEPEKEKIEINFNYKTENNASVPIDYPESWVQFSEGVIERPNIPPEFTSAELNQITDELRDIKSGKINSYEEFIDSSENFSENQKLVMLTAISNSSYTWGYDYSQEYSNLSKGAFFNKWKDFLNSKEDSSGVCEQFSSNLEQVANDLGVRTSAVTVIDKIDDGHAVDVSKTENGNSIIDLWKITFLDTKNVEKALEAYQKYAGTLSFQHLFFEDNQLKYRLITKDGKNFLDFIGYNPSVNSLEGALFNTLTPNSRAGINIAQEDFLTSGELNLFGLFGKIGEIRGDLSSPIDKLPLIQAGYKNNFFFPGIVLSPSLSGVYGAFKTSGIDKDNLYGMTGDLAISGRNETGFNFASEISGHFSVNEKTFYLFYDLPLKSGLSCKIPVGAGNITPYFMTQLNLVTKTFEIGKYSPGFDESKTGITADIPISKGADVSIDSYFSGKIYEYEFGANAKLKIPNLDFNLGGYVAKSTYDFAPDRQGIDIGASVSLGGFNVNLKYNNELQNYDGEASNNTSLSLNGSVSY
ncbi:MAG TPA: hypothetical protein VMC80_03015 [Patescibacteria group bacterium]|nr:hypothetical protein [Patescibacteria group bacterium]